MLSSSCLHTRQQVHDAQWLLLRRIAGDDACK
jgi:hypothetical protein